MSSGCNRRRSALICKAVLVTLTILFMIYLCAVALVQTQVQQQTICDVAKFSDAVKYGSSEDNWAGTANLSQSMEIIRQ
jgi:hypothetical protein